MFGAAWFTGRVSIDRDANLVTLLDVAVTDARFPNASSAHIEGFKRIVEAEIPKWELAMSYDDLVAGMAAVDKEKAASEKLNNTPPEIIFARKPTVLVLIDGEPVLREVENSKLKYVVNTPFFIVQDTVTGLFYLKGAEAWYSGRDVKGPWTAMRSSPPDEIVLLARQRVPEPPAEGAADSIAAAEPADRGEPVVPEVVVRTTPAEVIQTSGEPKFEPSKAPRCSTSRIPMTTSSWTSTRSSTTCWSRAAGTRRSRSPAGRGRTCPATNCRRTFRTFRPGPTWETCAPTYPAPRKRKKPLLENSIPQTAAVDRKTATVEVKYDGDPKFEKIEGTSMSYAVNTDKSVLLIDSKYYVCDPAIWFESAKAMGPWAVSTQVPPDVQSNSARVAGLQREVRLHLRFDAGGRVRRATRRHTTAPTCTADASSTEPATTITRGTRATTIRGR